MFNLQDYEIDVETVLRNVSPAELYQEALRYEKHATLSDTGELIAYSGDKTGRSPKDKRVVRHPDSADDVWWGPVNIGLDENVFCVNRERAIDYLNTRERLYVVDAFAGWDPKYRIKVRVICARPYHALVHAQHADSTDARRAGRLWRTGLRDLQRGCVSGQSLHRRA